MIYPTLIDETIISALLIEKSPGKNLDSLSFAIRIRNEKECSVVMAILPPKHRFGRTGNNVFDIDDYRPRIFRVTT